MSRPPPNKLAIQLQPYRPTANPVIKFPLCRRKLTSYIWAMSYDHNTQFTVILDCPFFNPRLIYSREASSPQTRMSLDVAMHRHFIEDLSMYALVINISSLVTVYLRLLIPGCCRGPCLRILYRRRTLSQCKSSDPAAILLWKIARRFMFRVSLVSVYSIELCEGCHASFQWLSEKDRWLGIAHTFFFKNKCFNLGRSLQIKQIFDWLFVQLRDLECLWKNRSC